MNTPSSPAISLSSMAHNALLANLHRLVHLHRLVRVAFIFLAATLMVFCLSAREAQAAWTQAGGTSGIRFISMSKLGSTLYSGSLSSGLYQSTDDGANWSQAFGGYFSTWSVNHVTQIGSVLYVGGNISNAARLAYSTDAGSTWTVLSSWSTASNITGIVQFNGATFAVAYNKGVYKSTTNDGTGWVLSNTGMTTQSAVKQMVQLLIFS
jgi:hypothetical protein